MKCWKQTGKVFTPAFLCGHSNYIVWHASSGILSFEWVCSFVTIDGSLSMVEKPSREEGDSTMGMGQWRVLRVSKFGWRGHFSIIRLREVKGKCTWSQGCQRHWTMVVVSWQQNRSKLGGMVVRVDLDYLPLMNWMAEVGRFTCGLEDGGGRGKWGRIGVWEPEVVEDMWRVGWGGGESTYKNLQGCTAEGGSGSRDVDGFMGGHLLKLTMGPGR